MYVVVLFLGFFPKECRRTGGIINVSTDERVEERLAEAYYSPAGYWCSIAAIPKLAKEAGVGKDEAHEWLTGHLADLLARTIAKCYPPT